MYYSTQSNGFHRGWSVFVVLCLAVVTGCSNFDHPLTWHESPQSNLLLGDWQTTPESDSSYQAKITVGNQGSLHVELSYSDEAHSQVKPETLISRASFEATLLEN